MVQSLRCCIGVLEAAPALGQSALHEFRWPALGELMQLALAPHV